MQKTSIDNFSCGNKRMRISVMQKVYMKHNFQFNHKLQMQFVLAWWALELFKKFQNGFLFPYWFTNIRRHVPKALRACFVGDGRLAALDHCFNIRNLYVFILTRVPLIRFTLSKCHWTIENINLLFIIKFRMVVNQRESRAHRHGKKTIR